MNSFERTMAAISHKEADRVPLFLLLSLFGAKELQMPIKQYFSKPENVVKAQIDMKEKYQNDCIYTFFYAPIEIEAFGGEVVFVEDGPPNSGEPFIKSFEQISKIQVPNVHQADGLKKVLTATELLKKEVKQEVPIIGVVMSPFSLPIMQMGFEKYLEMIYFRKKDFKKLMAVNEAFCVEWANAQLQAGATAICYFNPLASPSMIEKNTYLATGYEIDKRTILKIKGPTATHLASGRAFPVVEELLATGTAVLGFSGDDDLTAIKKATQNRLCLLGNLNGIDMVNWDSKIVNERVSHLITKAGQGGGLIISDNHGEIPWQVPEETLLELSEAVRKYGTYPLTRSH